MNSYRGQYNASPMYNMKNKHGGSQKETGSSGGAGQTVSTPQKRHALLSVLLSVVLPILFLVALLVPNSTVQWIFLGVTGFGVLMMWLLRAFVRSARNTLTVVYIALAAVIGLSLFINRQAPEARRTSSANTSQAASMFTNPDMGSVNAMLNEGNTPAPEEETGTVSLVPEAQQRLEAFFDAWGRRSVSEMKEYCLPSWVKEQTKAENVLFQMLMNSIPGKPDAEGISVSDGNAACIITLTASFTENGVSSLKRLHVIMKKVNEVWYVDPNSLDGVTVDEAAEAAAASYSNIIGTTIAPATPTPDPNELVVYYNTSGGKYYHLDRTCSAVSTEYWPLTGKIPFSLINTKPYDQLKPCKTCGAPDRPAVGQ